MVNFLFNAIFSFQTANTGRKSIEKSLATLIADVAKSNGFVFLIHDPVPEYIGVDDLALGTQAKTKKKVIVT